MRFARVWGVTGLWRAREYAVARCVGVPAPLFHDLVIPFNPGVGFRIGLPGHERSGNDEIVLHVNSEVLQDGPDCIFVGVDELFVHTVNGQTSA